MTYRYMPADLPTRLRAAGLKVVVIGDWQHRGRPASTGEYHPGGVLNHHTGSFDRVGDLADDLAYAKWLALIGRPDLPAPLCGATLSAEGTVYLLAGGRANHAGVARPSGSMAGGDGNAMYFGIEWMLSGTQKIPQVMYDAGVTLNAVLLNEFGNSEQAASCHFNTSVTGKWDIGDPDGVSGVVPGHKVLDVPKFRRAVKARHTALYATPRPKPRPRPVPVPPQPKAPKGAKTRLFRVHLVPGNKKQSPAQVRADMRLARAKTVGGSGVVFNTERESPALLQAVEDGLGKGWTRVLDNEVTIAFGSNWKPIPDLPFTATLLGHGKAHVTPDRKVSEAPVQNDGLQVAMLGTHLLSEANCVHVHVEGRAWREEHWPLQLGVLVDRVEYYVDKGIPVVLAGDLNTGVHFTGKQVLAVLEKRFGAANVEHAHGSNLDHIFLVSTKKARLTEVGQEVVTNDASDHNMVSDVVRVTVLP